MKMVQRTEDSLPGCLGRQASSLPKVGMAVSHVVAVSPGWKPVVRDRQDAYPPL
jgi:hypothetical protein